MLVFWEISRACLLSCRHCRAAAMKEPLPGELSTEEGLALLRDLRGFGDPPPILVLTGGDPLMRPDLFQLTASARALGIPLGLAPSVTPLLTEEAAARLRGAGLKTISISLDGAIASTHDAIRAVPDHFSRTLAALEMLLRMGFTVQVNTTVMRANAGQLADIAALLVGMGVRIWEVFFLVKVGRGTGMEDLSPSECEDVAHVLYEASGYGLVVRTVEAPFFRRVVGWRRQAGPIPDPGDRFSLGPLYQLLARRLRNRLGDPTGPPRAESARTRDGKGIVFIAHDGEVHPAGFLPLSLGNVRSRSIVDIYRFDPLLRAIRRAEFTGTCGVCEFKDPCGGSRARAFASSADPLGGDPACAYVPAPLRAEGVWR